jgi:transcription initiation factor TFIIIB Brf1 subunit/transcription initiation factor TFIIB
MTELRFIESSMSEKKRIREEASALIKKAVEKIVSDEFNLFKNVMMTIEMMFAFEAI